MIHLLFKTMKVSALVLLVLVLGHIPIENRSISDHIGSVIKGSFVQAKLAWISSKVDFTNGYQHTLKKKGPEKTNPSKPSHSFGSISGILKLNQN